MQPCENDYLKKLLALQQDGSGAISAPSNWIASEPLLRVETRTARVIRDFAGSIQDDSRVSPCWCFLVGGPGNGKSMAVRELVVALLANGALVTDVSGRPLAELEAGVVPAILEVYLRSRLIAIIAQDASVIANPYSADPNPSQELLELIAKCEASKCSLIACTNRGVLERAAASIDASGTSLSRLTLETVVKVGRDSNEALEKIIQDPISGLQILLIGAALDTGSLFEGAESPMEQLFLGAIEDRNWITCNNCSNAPVCPFFQNKKSLGVPSLRSNVLRLLEDAELIDGQPLVFREAGAIVSLLLAGCPADYLDASPCKWVADRVSEGGWFALASRRLHMALFSSTSPLGLDHEDPERQEKLLETVLDRANLDSISVLRRVATKVGVPRLFSAEGVLRKLDVMTSVPNKNLEKYGWDYEFGNAMSSFPSQLELNCGIIWRDAEAAFDEDWPEAAECMSALVRWRSAHTLRAGVVETGLFPWRAEMDTYRSAIGIPDTPSLAKKNALRELIKRVLDGGENSIRITANISLSNSSVGAVDIDWDASRRTRSLWLSMQGSEIRTKLSALAFVWLARRQQAPLYEGTFPLGWLESSRDAIARAAAASCYSRRDTGQLDISRSDGSVLRLLWEGTSVEVQALETDRG